ISNGSNGTDHGTVAPMFFIGNKVDHNVLGSNPNIPNNADWTYEMEMQYDFRQVYYSVIKQWLGGNEGTAEDVLFKKFDQLPIIQAKYVDTDGDGVSDDRDLCNNTPLGAMVNTDGCEIFSLPADNYTILTNGTSCSGKSNGKISISVAYKQHIYNLSIPETEESYSLNSDNEHQLEIDELEIGTYTLNFTVEGKEGYLQTFEIGITEPPSLSAKSSVNQKGKTMTVNLTGSDLYYTEVNGERTSYQINTFTLQLRPGMNTVRIYTPQDCQGEYVEQVFISEQVRHYPNPVKSDLNLVIPGEDSNTTVSLYSRSGSLVAKYEETIPFSRIVTINASQLPSDIYVIKVNGQTVDQTFKIIKR
ncbi:MAG: T9SS type A sorting domain-containing protein, partial [Flavobacteriaceae bacterium]